MQPISHAFNRAAVKYHGLSPLAVMFWIVAIDDDRQRREREKKRCCKRQALAQSQRKRKSAAPLGPRPF